MYRSTLNPREDSIKSQDFADVPNLMFNFTNASENHHDYDLGLWDRFIPYTPRQIYDLYTAGHQRDDLFLTVSVKETRRIEFEINREDEKDDAFLSKLIFIMGDEPEMHASKIVVDPDSQGKGIGRTAMRNWIETAAAFDFPVFSFNAAMSAGGAVWAKMGAHLDRNEARQPFYADEERTLADSLNARLEAARPFIGPENYEKARMYCQIQRPDDLVRLSAMGDVIVPRKAVEEAATVIPNYYGALMGATKDCMNIVRKELTYLSNIFCNSGRGMQEYVSLPSFLKKESVWSAVVDFTDNAQMQRVGDYLQGWRTIEPERP